MDDILAVLGRLEGGLAQLLERSRPALPLVLTVKAAAEQLSVSERTMRALVASGRVASVLVGNRRMVPSSVLLELAKPVPLEEVRAKREARRARLGVSDELEALAVLRRR